MSIYLNGTRLPDYSAFVKDVIENSTDNETQGGRIYTDFLNLRRTWKITWNLSTEAEFNLINGFYLWQFTNYQYPILFVPAYGLSKPVKLTRSEQNVKWNGEYTQDFTLLATERDAFS